MYTLMQIPILQQKKRFLQHFVKFMTCNLPRWQVKTEWKSLMQQYIRDFIVCQSNLTVKTQT